MTWKPVHPFDRNRCPQTIAVESDETGRVGWADVRLNQDRPVADCRGVYVTVADFRRPDGTAHTTIDPHPDIDFYAR